MADEKTDAPVEGEDDDALTAAEQRHMETGGEAPLDEEQKAEPGPEDQEAAEDKAEEKKVEDKPAGKDPSERVVEHGAFHEERERRKGLQRRLDEQGREFSEYKGKTEERLEAIAKRLAPPVEPAPDIDEDPVAHLAHRQDEADRRLDAADQRGEEQAQERQAAANDQALINAYRGAASEFAKDTPDFRDAYEHWKASLVSELKAWNVTAPAQVEQEVGKFERQLVAASFRDGVNPAERLYAISKHRGYMKAAPSKGEGNGGDKAKDRIAAEEKAEAAAKSLSGAGGKQTTGLSMESLLAMDEEEFDAVSEKDLRKAMGG